MRINAKDVKEIGMLYMAIQQEMEDNDVTLTELAEKMGTTRQSLYNLSCKPLSDPKFIWAVISMAKALDMRIEVSFR